jgi:putative spermidine/putrescine transport system permease protein
MQFSAPHRLIWLACLPAGALLAVFFFLPLLHIASLSVGWPHLSGAYFTAFINEPSYVQIAWRTLLIGLAVTGLTLLMAYPAAASLAFAAPRYRNLLLGCVLVPYLTSLLVRTYAWVILLNDQGPINQALTWLGLIDGPLPLLYSRVGMMIGMVHVMLPMMVLPLYANMQKVDPMLMRGARSLGAGALRTFWTIYLPQTMPGIRSGCTLVFIVSIGFYIIPMSLGGLSDVMLSNLIAQQVSTAADFSMASVIAFALLAVTGAMGVLLRTLGAWARSWRNAPQGGELRAGLLPQRLLNRVSGILWQRNLGRAGKPFLAPMSWIHVLGASVLLFLVLPSVVVVIVSFGRDDTLAFPPQAFSLHWYRAFFTSDDWLSATWLSARIAVLSTVLSLAFGTLAAFGLSRVRLEAVRQVGQGVMLIPLVIPPVVFALGAFSVLSGWHLVGSTTAIAFEHACLGLPLVVVIMSGAFAMFDRRLERASLSLGMSPLRTFAYVVMPLIGPSLLSAALLAFINSFDEVVLTSFIAGPEVRTLPLKMFEDIRNQIDPTIAAISAMLIAIPFCLLPLLRTGVSRKSQSRIEART